MMTDAQSSISFLEGFLSLAKRIEQNSLAVYSLRFDSLIFGSWILVAGTRKNRAQVTWDGKDFVLTCAVSSFQNASSHPIWRPAGSQATTPGDDVGMFAAAEQLIYRALGA
jgi:hypothetical protein